MKMINKRVRIRTKNNWAKIPRGTEGIAVMCDDEEEIFVVDLVDRELGVMLPIRVLEVLDG